MESKEEAKEIVFILKQNELEMMKLYIAFSQRFQADEAFWIGIAGEEESHAAWIETLNYKTDTGLVKFPQQRFPIDAIKKNIEFMKKVHQETLDGQRTSTQALELSVHLERGMLENKFFEVFKNDSIELQIILEALRLGTQEHLHAIEKVWKKERFGEDEILKA